MSITKGVLAQDALGMLGINTRTSDANAEELQAAIRTLDRWMRSQHARGYKFGYDFSSTDPTTPTQLPAWAEQWVVASLAREMCPFFGMSAQPEIMAAINAGKLAVDQRTIQTPSVRNPNGLPMGSGNINTTYGSNRFYNSERLLGDDGQFLEGETDVITVD